MRFRIQHLMKSPLTKLFKTDNNTHTKDFKKKKTPRSNISIQHYITNNIIRIYRITSLIYNDDVIM